MIQSTGHKFAHVTAAEGCRDMCKFVTRMDHYIFMQVQNELFTRFGSWAHKPFGNTGLWLEIKSQSMFAFTDWHANFSFHQFGQMSPIETLLYENTAHGYLESTGLWLVT